MRLFLSAALALSLCAGIARAAEDDEILSDLVVVTATPRPADVRMMVQTAKAGAPEKQAKADGAARLPVQDAAQPVKTASK